MSPQGPVLKAMLLLNIHISSFISYQVIDFYKGKEKKLKGLTTFIEETVGKEILNFGQYVNEKSTDCRHYQSLSLINTTEPAE